MSQQVTITSVTANTPVDISYCYANSGSCVYVATVSTFPYTFDVPDPYDTQDFVIKIVDTQGCIDGEVIYITPTPTPGTTPTQTVTPTVTITPTNTPSQTPTTTPTITVTSTVSSTVTPTPSVTPNLYYHAKGQNTYVSSTDCCGDILTSTYYYTYLSDGNTIPVVGIKVYTTQVSGTLYNPFNGNNRYLLMVWYGNTYAVKIDTGGNIVDFIPCSVGPTPTSTTTQTITPTVTTTNTPTNSQTPTPTDTPTNTPTTTTTNTSTNTQTPTSTATPTNTPTTTTTNTPTNTQTPTNSQTPTTTQTPSATGVSCTGFTIYSEWSVGAALTGFFKIPSTGVTYTNDTQYTVFSYSQTYHVNPASDVVAGGGVSPQVSTLVLNCPTSVDGISAGGQVIQSGVSKSVTLNIYRNGVIVDTTTQTVGPFLFVPFNYQFTALDIGGTISANDVFKFEWL